MPLRNATIILLVTVLAWACYWKAQNGRFAGEISSAIRFTRDNYLQPVDERLLFESAMKGMVSALDEHSAYIPPRAYQDVNRDLEQVFGGIGIVMDPAPTTGELTVRMVLPDSPAQDAGLMPGDVLVSADGTPLAGRSLPDAGELIRGPIGTTVELLVRRDGVKEPFPLAVTRNTIQIDSVKGDRRDALGHWIFTLEDAPRIGYIRVEQFGEQTARELKSALTAIGPTIDGLILDLRDNPGGLLRASVEVCDLFLSEGTIVSIRGRSGVPSDIYTASPGIVFPPDKPIVVLVNGFAASAAEITAACLQDHGRAVVVGERSWGKGTVQNLHPMEGGQAALKLTTATYWRPSNTNIHRFDESGPDEDWGVSPDSPWERINSTEDERTRRLWRQDRDLGPSIRRGTDGSAASPPPESLPDLDQLVGPDESTAPRSPLGSPDLTPVPEDRLPPNLRQTYDDDRQLRAAIEALRPSLPASVLPVLPTDRTGHWVPLRSRPRFRPAILT